MDWYNNFMDTMFSSNYGGLVMILLYFAINAIPVILIGGVIVAVLKAIGNRNE